MQIESEDMKTKDKPSFLSWLIVAVGVPLPGLGTPAAVL